MNRVITNLLEMTRLEAGVHVKKDWCPLEEIVGAACQRTASGAVLDIAGY